MSLESFKGTRAWLQRIEDAKIFSGWVQNLAQHDAVIETTACSDLRAGDEFMVQAFGHGECATFKARLRLCNGALGSFAIEGRIRFLRSKEEPRLLVYGLVAQVEDEYAPFEARVVDISPSGVGLLASVPIEKGAKVRLSLTSPVGQVEASGVVRYSRQLSDGPAEFRIGVKLDKLDRLSQARWNKLLEGIAAA